MTVTTKMELPITVGSDVLHETLRFLGVPEERWRDVLTLHLESGVWHLRFVRRDEKGHVVIVRQGNDARCLEESFEIKVKLYADDDLDAS